MNLLRVSEPPKSPASASTLFIRPLARIVLLMSLVLLAIGPAVVPIETGAQELEAFDGQSRFTVLILGIDRRPRERDSLQVRTDAMIVASINPETQSIGLLHIPRDMHLVTPDTGEYIRANTLLQEGERLQEGYGAYYAMDAVTYNLGMFVDRYVLFDFIAFETIVDAIGGIEITTLYTIDDPTYPALDGPGFDPFYLPAGTHLLDGHTALQYARTRHGDNDFVRGLRQIEVVQAIHRRITEEEMLLELLAIAPMLVEDLEGNFYTDMALDEMISLGFSVLDVPDFQFYTNTINTDYNLIIRDGGRNIYVPNTARLPQLLTEVFGADYFE